VIFQQEFQVYLAEGAVFPARVSSCFWKSAIFQQEYHVVATPCALSGGVGVLGMRGGFCGISARLSCFLGWKCDFPARLSCFFWKSAIFQQDCHVRVPTLLVLAGGLGLFRARRHEDNEDTKSWLVAWEFPPFFPDSFSVPYILRTCNLEIFFS
jgi:hypothetical protein